MSRNVYRRANSGELCFELRIDHLVDLSDITRVIADELAARERDERIKDSDLVSASEDTEPLRTNIDSKEAILEKLRNELYQSGEQWWYRAEDEIEGTDNSEEIRSRARKHARNLFPELDES